MDNVTIAIDAMGGDHGVTVTVPGAIQALQQHPKVKLILVGDEATLKHALGSKLNTYAERLSIHHASEQVLMNESPSKALRTKKDSSMRVAINLVKEGIASACVSAGNTGALMATAHFVLKSLPGIDRPALIASMPTMRPDKGARMLDLGANVDSNADQLYQFAVMGSVVTSAVDKIPHPKVGLLNIGEEEIKGNDLVKRTAQLLTESPYINYIGYVEGTDIFKGEVDVVVCDGFVGNVALKSIEGVAKLVGYYTKQAYTESLWGKLAALFSYPVLKKLKARIDPGKRNGASLLGLKGIVIKSHGSATAPAFAHAITEAILEAQQNVPQQIHEHLSAVLKDGVTEESGEP